MTTRLYDDIEPNLGPKTLDMHINQEGTYEYQPSSRHKDKINHRKGFKSVIGAMLMWAAGLAFSPGARADTHFASTNGANIFPYTNETTAARFVQDAIDASEDGDTVKLDNSGFELFTPLDINKGITMTGTGTNTSFTGANIDASIIHGNIPNLINISTENPITIKKTYLTGGEHNIGGSWEWYAPSIPKLITGTNADLTLDRVRMEKGRNFTVTMDGGTLLSTNSTVTDGKDVGFELRNGCNAKIYKLNLTGSIDHPISSEDDSSLTLHNSKIQSSSRKYGSLRIYGDADIQGNTFHRLQGGAPMELPNYPNIALHVIARNNATNNVNIKNNTFDNTPIAIGFGGKPTAHFPTKVQGNTISNSEYAVYISGADHEQVDMGGGITGSLGNNNITSTNPASYTVYLVESPGKVMAVNNNGLTEDNMWHNPDDPATGWVTTETYTSNGIPTSWAYNNNLTTNLVVDNSKETENPDNDPHSNLQEYRADTDPNDPQSYHRITSMTTTSNQPTIEWPSSPNRSYTVYTGPNLESMSSTPTMQGTGETMSYTDTNTSNNTSFFRVDVHE